MQILPQMRQHMVAHGSALLRQAVETGACIANRHDIANGFGCHLILSGPFHADQVARQAEARDLTAAVLSHAAKPDHAR
ncbi:MAG: hypothetical protein WDM89_12735 [Rhizomicrobium sp.]